MRIALAILVMVLFIGESPACGKRKAARRSAAMMQQQMLINQQQMLQQQRIILLQQQPIRVIQYYPVAACPN